jgi:hypothetical protein
MHIGIKVGIGSFVNTVIVPLGVAYFIRDNWLENLITLTCSNIITMSFLFPLLDFINIKHLWKSIRRRCLRTKNTNLLWKQTQAEINAIFEPPEFDVGVNFARLSMLVIVPIVFFPIFPLGPFLTCAGLFCTYWMEKVTRVFHAFNT